MNLDAVDLRLLRGLIAVARLGTFARAAQQLHITPSALSQQMKELSGHLGVALFERQGRQAVLSEAARELFARITPLIEQIDQSLQQTVSAPQKVAGRFRIGATQTYLRALAMPAALKMIRRHPELRVDLRQLPAQRLLADLLEGELDMAVLPEVAGQNNVSQTRLLTEQMAVLGTPALLKPLGRRPALQALAGRPLALLNRDFLIRQLIDKQARHDRLSLDIRLEVSGMDDLMAAARGEHLLVVGSALACPTDDPVLQLRPLQGKFLSRTAVLCWRKGRVLSGSMLAFQAEVQALARQTDRTVQAARPVSPGLANLSARRRSLDGGRDP